MSRIIEMTANVILTFDGKPQQFHDTTFNLTPATGDGLDAMEVDVIRQILEPVDNADLQDLVKISLMYDTTGTENGKTVYADIDPEVRAAMDHLIRNDAKYYFQPDQRDDYEQRLVIELGIASRTRDFA